MPAVKQYLLSLTARCTRCKLNIAAFCCWFCLFYSWLKMIYFHVVNVLLLFSMKDGCFMFFFVFFSILHVIWGVVMTPSFETLPWQPAYGSYLWFARQCYIHSAFKTTALVYIFKICLARDGFLAMGCGHCETCATQYPHSHRFYGYAVFISFFSTW